MSDILTSEQRSLLMSKIRSKDTGIELFVRSYFFARGLRYRLHSRNMPGKPDLVLNKYNTIVFIHGCFWHGHNSKRCSIARMPKSNVEFWREKIKYNQLRDRKNIKYYKSLGYKVFILWECKIKSKDSHKYLDKVIDKIKSE